MMRPISSRADRPRRRPLTRRRAGTAMLALAVMLWWSATASAQLDPLLFIKRVPPTVIVVLDTSFRMLYDGDGYYRDVNTYTVADDVAVATALGVNVVTATQYRRKYQNFDWDGVTDDNKKYLASTIVAVPNTSDDFASFYARTRFEIAKAGIAAAVAENNQRARWGLVKLRQDTPTWRVSPGCDKPVTVSDASLLTATDGSPCNAPGPGKFVAYPPRVATPNYDQSTLGAGLVVAPTIAASAAMVLDKVTRPLLDSQGLIPASRGGQGYADRPLTLALLDARKAAIDAMAADTAANRTCRNTVVVLVTGGKDSGSAQYLNANDAAATASTFLSVASSGTTKRVPIHVVSVKPVAAEEASLQTIATNSGGTYQKVTTAAEITAAINYAVQGGYARAENFDAGTKAEYLPVSPIIGTVNLKNGRDAAGGALPNTDIVANPGGQQLPQRSNVLLSSGFSLPGFAGVMRAFRVYKPVADSTKPTGWKFVNDGTKLWPDLDGRPSLAGMARTPADPNSRNIYTFVPDGAGGGSVVAFTPANAGTLAAHMNVGDAVATAAAITTVRAQPLGAIIGSTPALMDVPSLDPPPDDDYGRADAATSFAGRYKDRRAMIFFGANDGMIHAVDARTGYEVWAFIPYNLLPKLRTLLDGQPVEQFDYFVDSSPKIAEVKIAGAWKSMLIIGQGPGGTFYQAFDVTEAGMGVAPDQDSLATVSQLLGQFDSPNESIEFEWAFPNYSNFDPTYTATFTVADATAGGKVKIFGDLKAGAPYAEKTVGYTWSDPAVGALDSARTTTAVIVGSGYFPDIESQIPSRGAAAPKAGNAMYLIDAGTGRLLGNAGAAACPSISSGSGSGPGCAQVPDVNGNGRKNALQADPTAAGDNGSFIVKKAYIGDLDGKYWRFDFTPAGDISVNQMVDTGQPIYASSALLFIGSADVYMFFSTGSDILPSSASGGTGTFKLYGLKDNAPAAGATTKFSKSLAAVSNTNGLATGERPSTSPSVAGDIVFYTTTVESAASPCADFSANLYALTFVGGAAYDANNNGRIDSNESTVVKTVAGRATAPFIVDQHLYFGTSKGSGSGDGSSPGGFIEAFGDPEDFNNGVGQVGVRILSWRELR
jgi:hypothetical protein